MSYGDAADPVVPAGEIISDFHREYQTARHRHTTHRVLRQAVHNRLDRLLALPPGSLLLHIGRLAVGASGQRLDLGPLGVDDTVGLVSSMLVGERVSEEFAGFVHVHTGGVPLAVEEAVRLMAARADLTRRGGQWVRRQLAQLTVPPPVRDAVLERAGRLAPGAQAVLRATAVLGEPAAEATLAAVTGLPPGLARAGLSQGLACGLLTEGSGVGCRCGTHWPAGPYTRRFPVQSAGCCTGGPGML